MSTKRHFGPLRGFCAAGIFLVLGSAAQADLLPPDGDTTDDGGAVVLIAVDGQDYEDPAPDGYGGAEPGDPGDGTLDGTGEPVDHLVDGDPDRVFDDGDCGDCVYATTTALPLPESAPHLPGIRADRRDAPVRAAARAPRNICTEADLYVAWLCAWQGYARP